MDKANFILEQFDNAVTDKEYLLKCYQIVEEFVNTNEKNFSFSSISEHDHNEYLKHLFHIITLFSPPRVAPENKLLHENLVMKSFVAIRLLSRDRNLVNSIETIDKYLDCFIKIINSSSKTYNSQHCSETLKCLCNWVYHNAVVRTYLMDNKVASKILKLLCNTDGKSDCLDEILLYKLRLLFLMSALESSERQPMLENGVIPQLTSLLRSCMSFVNEKNSEVTTLHESIMAEILKALFNVALELSNVITDQITSDCCQLVLCLRDMLLKYHATGFDELITHIAHMFVNIPKETMYCLIENDVLNKNDKVLSKCNAEEKVWNMSAIDKMLDVLIIRLKIQDYTIMKEKSIAILTAFSYISRINPEIRKYLRSVILPPYVASEIRPEEHDDTRGMIVRMMTTVDIPLKNMAADFLFVLCKENTKRLIRYAGYGNSAGYLASRGLMIPGMVNTEGDYSDDELTDADESDVDIVIGAKTTEQDSIMSMTEEEKEIEAHKLMCMMERLNELNVIKPMRICPEGKLTELKKDDSLDD